MTTICQTGGEEAAAVVAVAVVVAAAAVVAVAVGQAEQVDMEEAALSGYSS